MTTPLDKPGLSPNEIRAELVRRGIKQTSIAEMLGVTAPAVNQVISGVHTSARIRQAVALHIGRPVEEIWPTAEAA